MGGQEPSRLTPIPNDGDKQIIHRNMHRRRGYAVTVPYRLSGGGRIAGWDVFTAGELAHEDISRHRLDTSL